MDINFGGDKAIADRASMKNKLETMYALGVRDFAIFFDDIKDKNGVKQAEFLNWVDDNFVKKAAYDIFAPAVKTGRISIKRVESIIRNVNYNVLVLHKFQEQINNK